MDLGKTLYRNIYKEITMFRTNHSDDEVMKIYAEKNDNFRTKIKDKIQATFSVKSRMVVNAMYNRTGANFGLRV